VVKSGVDVNEQQRKKESYDDVLRIVDDLDARCAQLQEQVGSLRAWLAREAQAIEPHHADDPLLPHQSTQATVERPGWAIRADEARVGGPLLVLVIMVLQALLPASIRPPVLGAVYVVEGALLVLAALPIREERRGWIRPAMIVLTLLIIATTIQIIVRVVHNLASVHTITGRSLLIAGGLTWLIIVCVFALIYWQLDGGGPYKRVLDDDAEMDWRWPQQEDMPPGHLWLPRMTDYVALSFFTSSAFSPTDAMPWTRSAKLLMVLQAFMSFTLAVLIIARAVNTLA
jgi:uncharacterized membrane protein